MSRRPVTTLGLQFAGYSFAGVPDEALFEHLMKLALSAEATGFDSLWTMDHLHQIEAVGRPDEPILEAYTTLAALAARTSTVRLGVLVTAAGFRNPALLAKMVTTIDIISQGRVILGLGAGWHEEEFLAYGMEFPSAGKRIAALVEAAQICRAMFTEHAPTFTGEHSSVARALNSPAPLQRAGPPILIGGSGERVLIPAVAKYADACNFVGAPDTIRHKVSVLETACAAAGRDPGEITKTWLGPVVLTDSEMELHATLDRVARLYGMSPRAVRGFALCGDEAKICAQVAAYRRAGVDGFIVTTPSSSEPDFVRRVGRTLRSCLDRDF